MGAWVGFPLASTEAVGSPEVVAALASATGGFGEARTGHAIALGRTSEFVVTRSRTRTTTRMRTITEIPVAIVVRKWRAEGVRMRYRCGCNPKHNAGPH